MLENILKSHEGILLRTFQRMAENAAKQMKFRVRSTEEDIEGYSYFDPVVEQDWQEKYRIFFKDPWLYSSWDEPLLPDGTIVTLEIECWEPRWVRNIQEVEE